MRREEKSQTLEITETELTDLLYTINATLIDVIKVRNRIKKLLNESCEDRPSLRILSTDNRL